MKKKFVLTTAFVIASGLSLAHAANIDKGMALFEDPTLGGGKNGYSCKSCHEGGRNIGADLFTREKLTIMGNEVDTVANIINVCIEKPLGGKALDVKGEEMQDLISYLKKLIAK